MRNLLQTAMKHYLRCELLKARHRLGLTQEQMAARLWMSTRSYTALEGGQACFGLATFLLFLFRCCRTEEETKAFWAACRHFRGYRAGRGLKACGAKGKAARLMGRTGRRNPMDSVCTQRRTSPFLPYQTFLRPPAGASLCCK